MDFFYWPRIVATTGDYPLSDKEIDVASRTGFGVAAASSS